MSIRATQITIILLCAAGLYATTLASGWFLLLFGLVFLVSFCLQTWMVLAATPVWQGIKKRIYLITLVFLVCCLFREDYASSHNSTHSPITVIGAELGLLESHRYAEVSPLFVFVYFAWLVVPISQIIGLVSIRQWKKEVKNKDQSTTP